MPSADFSPADRALTLRLDGVSPAEAQQVFRRLAGFLAAQSDRPFACLGATILAALPEPPPPDCAFCRLERKRTGDPGAKGCPF
jgi:hypothetical protein